MTCENEIQTYNTSAGCLYYQAVLWPGSLTGRTKTRHESARHCTTDQGEREREMFYLTTHSTHFIYGYMASDMVKDHSDSEKGNLLPPHRLLLSINSKGSFICTIPQTG